MTEQMDQSRLPFRDREELDDDEDLDDDVDAALIAPEGAAEFEEVQREHDLD